MAMDLSELFAQELKKLKNKRGPEKWSQLERLHIIGQTQMRLHYKTHFLMLREAIKEKMPRETLGQILRIVLVFPGHVFHKLPVGNVGSSRVSAFKPMPLPDDLKRFLKP